MSGTAPVANHDRRSDRDSLLSSIRRLSQRVHCEPCTRMINSGCVNQANVVEGFLSGASRVFLHKNQ